MTIVCHRSEMGQGIRSSLPVLIADELGAEMARVTIVQADGDKAYGDQNTDGSNSVRGIYEDMRRVGATARDDARRGGREALERAARRTASREDHAVIHLRHRSARWGSASWRSRRGKLPVPSEGDVALRPRRELTHVGQAAAAARRAGVRHRHRPVYGADIKLPGHAHRGDRAAAGRGRQGRAVRRDASAGGAGRAQGRRDAAAEAAVRVPAVGRRRGDRGAHVGRDAGPRGARRHVGPRAERRLRLGRSTARSCSRRCARRARSRARSATSDAALAKRGAASSRPSTTSRTSRTCRWSRPSRWRASPANAARSGRPRRTRRPRRPRSRGCSGIDEENVRVHVTLLGGGFGRKSKADFGSEAALLSRADAARPVRVQWTREDDVQHDYYNTVSTKRLTRRARRERQGDRVAPPHRVPVDRQSCSAGRRQPSNDDLQQGVLDLALAVPNVRAETCEATAHTRIGWLRSVYNIFQAFAIGSFIDEIAHARGADPRDVWLEVLGPARQMSLAELGRRRSCRTTASRSRSTPSMRAACAT